MDEGGRMPDVTVTLADGATLRLADLPMPAVLYFYPKDDTSGCTREAQDFTALGEAFAAAGASVLGISKDNPASHAKFARQARSVRDAGERYRRIGLRGVRRVDGEIDVRAEIYGDRAIDLPVRSRWNAGSTMGKSARAGPCRGGAGGGE